MKYFTLLFVLLFIFGCQKENEPTKNDGKLQFGIIANQNKTLKSALIIAKPAFILIDVEDENGKSVFINEKIELFSFQETILSKPIQLEQGNYKLKKFLVLDETGNVIYATPKEGSKNAYLVNMPLDIFFSISKDVVTQLNPEVLSTEEQLASDFGYVDATFTIIETFDFLISTFVYNDSSRNFELTNSIISVSNGIKTILVEPLLPITNQITLNEAINSYFIKIEKDGYRSFSAIITIDSLKVYMDKPWIIVLEKQFSDLDYGLAAFYPFNGNANDESGNQNHGLVKGATSISDRFGNENSAYFFDGNESFIELPNAFDFLPRTIDLWFNTANSSYNYNYGGIFQSDNPNQQFGNSGIAVKEIEGIKKLLLTISATTDTFDLNSNTWYNVAIVANAINEISFYVNGYLIGTKNYTDYLSSVNGLMFSFIGSNRTGSDNYFIGVVDDIRIYNRELSQVEVELLFKEGL